LSAREPHNVSHAQYIRMAEVVASSPIPVLAAGGPPDGSDLIDYGTAVMAAGCHGLAVGRRIFSAQAPASLVARLAAVVHAGAPGTRSPFPTIMAGAA
jgi:2-amino-4,5-dihydroxy-6-oxo-7-(phosphonooxy)heptanoate synthase